MQAHGVGRERLLAKAKKADFQSVFSTSEPSGSHFSSVLHNPNLGDISSNDNFAFAPPFRPLVTEVFSKDDPNLDEDSVFGVREGLVVAYQYMPAGSFPASGFELSGKVDDA